jgi:hypothetical protein
MFGLFRWLPPMPIREKLRASKFPTIHNYLKMTMCNIHDEFLKRADTPALADLLRTSGGWSAASKVLVSKVL